MKKYLILFALLTMQLNGFSQVNRDTKEDNSLLKELDNKKSLIEKSFIAVLQAHLNAIQNRNLDEYVKTISQKSDITVILSNGKILNNRDSIIAMHKEWFASKTWVFNYTVEQTIIKNDFAIALLAYNYQDIDEHGKPYEFTNLLSLLFECQNGEWRLIFDQNTRKK